MNVQEALSTPALRRASLVASFVALAFAVTVQVSKSSAPAGDASSRTSRIKQPGNFDPAVFTVMAPQTFEDLRVGEVFRRLTLPDSKAAERGSPSGEKLQRKFLEVQSH